MSMEATDAQGGKLRGSVRPEALFKLQGPHNPARHQAVPHPIAAGFVVEAVNMHLVTRPCNAPSLY